MGIVYIAETLHPNSGKVALKIIKPGMDTEQVIARFEAERQTLAIMDHPHIAKVLGAGTTENGRPYFAMELVRGLPITAYCDRHARPTRQRLELFVTVCHAVQHAHDKGIIHRDLKPGNLLVARAGDREIPKVIDFGVAKATQQQFTDVSVYTQFHQIIGTPLYMSPEQTDSGSDVDLRCDVYSLGVVLYEMLTGTTPIQRENLGSISFDEVRRIIREVDPVRPSERISTLTADGTKTVVKQQSNHRRFSHYLAGELDWIVMKALDKDRDRRYESANALAADIQRFLDSEPVVARPPSMSYRLRKFARRNTVFLTTAGLVLATLLLGILGTTRQANRARRERDQKIAALEKSEAHLDLARETIDELHRRIDLETSSPDESTIRNALDLSYSLANSLDHQGDQRHEMGVEFDRIADLHHAIGEDEKAATALEKSLNVQKEILADDPDDEEHQQDAAMSFGKLAFSKLFTADGEGAIEAIQQGREYFLEFAEAGAAKMEVPLALFPIVEAAVQICLGDYESAARLSDEAEKTASSLNGKKGLPDLAFLIQSANSMRVLSLLARGRYDESKPIASRSLKICEQLVAEDHPDAEVLNDLVAMFCDLLAEISIANGQYAEAVGYLQRGLRANPDIAELNNSMANLLATCNQDQIRDPSQAVEFARKAVKIEPEVPDFHNTLGVALYRLGQYRESLTALENFTEITDERDGINGFFSAMAHHQLGNSKEARECYEEAAMWTEKWAHEWVNGMEPREDEELRGLRAEAETLIGIVDKSTSSPPE